MSGLWATHANPRNFSQVGDFATIVHRQQALGFNAVRLPFRYLSRHSSHCVKALGIVKRLSISLFPGLCRFADLNLPPKDVRRACIADSFDEIRVSLSHLLRSTGDDFGALKCRACRRLSMPDRSIVCMQGNLTNPTEPYSTYPPDPASFPKQRAPIQKPNDVSSTRVCNSYLPHDTTLNRSGQ